MGVGGERGWAGHGGQNVEPGAVDSRPTALRLARSYSRAVHGTGEIKIVSSAYFNCLYDPGKSLTSARYDSLGGEAKIAPVRK